MVYRIVQSFYNKHLIITYKFGGALSRPDGRALHWRSKGCLFKTHGIEPLCCVHELDFIRCLVLVQPRKTGNCPDMTEVLLTGTQSTNRNNKQYKQFLEDQSDLGP